MNKEVVIKKCNICNSVVRVLEGNSDISCCGNKMVTLTPNSVEASFEKHMPTYEKAGDKISVTVNHVMDDDHYIEYILYVYDNKEENGAIFEEGSCIASDLILKVIGINGRKIKLPVKISYVKEYCISNLVEEKNIRKTLLWIVLELSVVSYFLNN